MAKRLSRREIAQYIAGRLEAGDDRKAVLNELAAFLLDARRLSETALIVRDIESELAAKGHVVGTIQSAFPLSDSTKQAITKRIKQELNAKTVDLDEQQDEAIVGGYRVTLPGRQLDQTISTQLTTLKTRFRKV